MMTSTFLVSPSPPTGNHRRIELAGIDIWIMAQIDNLFAYPSDIQLDRFKDALARTLSLWPLVAGRLVLEKDEHYFIEMCDNPVPVAFVVNHELPEWPLDANVVVEADNQQFTLFLDPVQVTKAFDQAPNEPLVRFKLTHLLQSNEWVLGISWYHWLGDAASCLHFSSTLSRLCQQMEPSPLLPIFERHLWREEKAEQTTLPIPKQFVDAQSKEEISKTALAHQSDYDPITMHVSGAQMATLQRLAGGKSVTMQDALTAYIIRTLNSSCYQTNDERRILHTVTAVNFRGVFDSIALPGHVSNALFMLLSDDFDDPYSLSSIAATIRRSISRMRDPTILEPAITTIDRLMRENVRNDRSPNPALVANELAVNSNYRFDWAGQVDFGCADRCRFYTVGSQVLYLRVFRLNPIKEGDAWRPRDCDGAEVSFRVERDLREQFISAWQRDVAENFQNVKK